MTQEEFLKIRDKEVNGFRHRKMMPWYRKLILPNAAKINSAHKAAVLLHVFQGPDDLELLFMKRPDYNGTHGGQVSFPGGKQESIDRSFKHTALREAEEEVGLKHQNVEVIRSLSECYIPPSNFVVYPYVSFAGHLPDLNTNSEEVAYTFSIPIEALCSGELEGKAKISTKMGKMNVPAYHWNDEIIWGATANITSELIALLS